MTSSEDVKKGADWLGANKGFVSLVLGFGSVVVSIAWTSWSISDWAGDVVHTMNLRLTVTERRLDAAEDSLSELKVSTRSISDEQLRRTTPVADVRALQEKVNHIEETLRETSPRDVLGAVKEEFSALRARLDLLENK